MSQRPAIDPFDDFMADPADDADWLVETPTAPVSPPAPVADVLAFETDEMLEPEPGPIAIDQPATQQVEAQPEREFEAASAAPIAIAEAPADLTPAEEVPAKPARRWFGRLSLFGVLGFLLLAAIGVAGWQMTALAAERDALALELDRQEQAHAEAQQTVRQATVQLATMRREMAAQLSGSAEQQAAAEAERARLQQLAQAECTTPRAVLIEKNL